MYRLTGMLNSYVQIHVHLPRCKMKSCHRSACSCHTYLQVFFLGPRFLQPCTRQLLFFLCWQIIRVYSAPLQANKHSKPVPDFVAKILLRPIHSQMVVIGTVKTLLGDGQTITVAAIASASILGAPLLEEYTYRGFLLPSLTKWMPTPAAVSCIVCMICCVSRRPALMLAQMICQSSSPHAGKQNNPFQAPLYSKPPTSEQPAHASIVFRHSHEALLCQNKQQDQMKRFVLLSAELL